MTAINILNYQRNSGGWPKNIADYTKKLTPAEEADIKSEASRNDATIDNSATVKEIRFLAEQYQISGKKEYLKAVENGISYLLKAQYSNGGWPQYFPDTSGYRKHITYNDHAMINVLTLLQDVSLGMRFMNGFDKSLVSLSKASVLKGIDCILNTQVKVKGKLTAWCAQHDKDSLVPAKARSYELISLSGSESVGILQFLMNQKKPSEKIKTSILEGVNWLKAVQLKGFKYEDIPDSSKPKGYDRLLIKHPESVLWARFYEVETNEPFVCGRDGIKKRELREIEYERRAGYAWYGSWAKELLEVKFPVWAGINLSKSVSSK
ncbi:MAG: pectate lyase [Pyrinomonadaceae bacterium]|nr:pectate lyase [Sphingobacteriaceae bacterium]